MEVLRVFLTKCFFLLNLLLDLLLLKILSGKFLSCEHLRNQFASDSLDENVFSNAKIFLTIEK